MSRRHQSRRRRSYGRRQHEMRERRTTDAPELGWTSPQTEIDWTMVDLDEDRHHAATDDGIGGFAR